MMIIKHRKTGKEEIVRRVLWEDSQGYYAGTRQFYEIIDQGTPVVWTVRMSNGNWAEQKIMDLEEAEVLNKKDPKNGYIELDDSRLQPTVPISDFNPTPEDLNQGISLIEKSISGEIEGHIASEEEQGKLKFDQEELYLLWFLQLENEYNKSKYHDVTAIIQEVYGEVSDVSIGTWVLSLKLKGYIETFGADGYRSRITKEGLSFIQKNQSLFENFGLESARKDFAKPNDLKFALSTFKDDMLLKKWGLVCQDLLGYAFSESTQPSSVLNGYYSEERDYYYYSDGTRGYDPPKLLQEQEGFNVHLISEKHSGFDRSELLNLHSFVNEDDKQICLTQPRLNILDDYGFRSNQPQRGLAVCLSKSPFEGSVPVYLYTNKPEIRFFEPVLLRAEKNRIPPQIGDESQSELRNLKIPPQTIKTDYLFPRHTLTTVTKSSELTARQYELQGLIGYIRETPNKGSIGLVSRHLFDMWDDYTTLLDTGEIFQGEGEFFTSETLGYVDLKAFDSSIRLRCFFNDDAFNNLYCTNPNEKLLGENRFYEESLRLGEQFDVPVYISKKPRKGYKPLYCWSTQPDLRMFEPLSETKLEGEEETYGDLVVNEEYDPETDSNKPKPNYDHSAPFIVDTLAKEDKLNRKVLMEIVCGKVVSMWDQLESDDSFTILLNGEWGSGKSTMLYYLEQCLKNKQWSVVNYNAWRNQRFDDPWWILVNKVSKEIPREVTIYRGTHYSRSHRRWKFKLHYSNTYLVALITSALLIAGVSTGVFGDKENISFYAGVLALIASLWFSVNGAITNLLRKRTFSELQAKNANDPLELYKKRFEQVVKDKKVAIFIDDLDRCEVGPTVKLLEGIQTLFKESKVLYVIAADGQWVSNCFDKKYDKFDLLVPEGQTIGNQFLQKTFQLIVDVPKIGREQLTHFLNFQLGKIDETAKASEIRFQRVEIESKTSIPELAHISKVGDAEAKRIATEQIAEVVKNEEPKLQHYILKFQEENDLPLNPRQMKRLINLYTMKMQELSNSKVLGEVGDEAVLRYILFSTEFSKYNSELRHMTIEKFEEKHPQMVELMRPLTPKMIKDYL